LPKEIDPFEILKGYIANKRTSADAERALKQLSDGTPRLKEVTSRTYQGRDYQRYDHLITGWTLFFNSNKAHNTSLTIDPMVIKALMVKETQVGYYTSSSPNANPQNDVMQAIDPRNPNIYDHVGANPARVYVHNENRQYVPLSNIGYSPNQSGRFAEIIPVASTLFGEENGNWYYQYSNSNPVISTCIGVMTYQRCLLETGDKWRAVERYNGSSDAVNYRRWVRVLYDMSPPIIVEDVTI